MSDSNLVLLIRPFRDPKISLMENCTKKSLFAIKNVEHRLKKIKLLMVDSDCRYRWNGEKTLTE